MVTLLAAAVLRRLSFSSSSRSSDDKAAKPDRTPWFFRIVRNWVSLAGAVLAMAAVFALVLLSGVDLFAKHANPYN